MTNPHNPDASHALREAVTRFVADGLPITSSEQMADHFLSPPSPIASELARLTGERDEAIEKASRMVTKMKEFAAAYLVVANTAETEEARALSAEAELATLRAALSAAEARGRAAGLEDADDREVNRILAMSDEDAIAEIVAEGRDPDALAEAMRGQMGATFKLCEEIKMLREAVKPFAAIFENGEPAGPVPRGLLDSKITRQDLRRAHAALAAIPPKPPALDVADRTEGGR